MSGIRQTKRWSLLPQHRDVEHTLMTELNVPSLVARVLAARGVASIDEARAFLNPSLARDWHDPAKIPNMVLAADRIEHAIYAGESIAVFGDFDVDGMSATCLLTLALRELGARVRPYIPHRFGEGYGLSKEALSRMLEEYTPDLIITVDNGIAAKEEVAWLTSDLHIDVVVTDHHEPAELVPEGVPVVDPKLDLSCPSQDLAGAGVALKLVDILGKRFGKPDLWLSLTEVATLGTVSDMMVLAGENRALVADGIACMQQTKRPGIRALAEMSRVSIASITADDLPFTLVPRLNAAGRMGTTDVAFDLLMAEEPEEAKRLAQELENTNRERRDIEATLTRDALAKAEALYDGGRVIVVAGEGWHEGVKGIVASRITNHYHVPAILFTVSDGLAKGSGRSVGSVNLFQAVEKCADLLIRFGGHAGAVGVSLDVANLDAFRERLEEVMSELPEEQFEDIGEVSAVASLKDMTVDNIAALECLQPFGQGNKRPLFAICDVVMRNRARVGQEGAHLRFNATDGFSQVGAIMFHAPHIERASNCDEVVDLVVDPHAETWQGRTKAKFMVQDILYRDTDPMGEQQDSLVAELFEKVADTLNVDELKSIAQAERFTTKVAGIAHDDRASVAEGLTCGDTLYLVRDSQNNFDENAIALYTQNHELLGYLKHQVAEALAPKIDAGASYSASVSRITSTSHIPSVHIELRYNKEASHAATHKLESAHRVELEAMGEEELEGYLVHEMIGNNPLLAAQKMTLDLLREGKSALTVMATGRGKSLIFHIHAVKMALLKHKASVFVYPLRALVSDQSYHLQHSLGTFGLVVEVINGETPQDERARIFYELAQGTIDVLLTTPEFFTIHHARFADAGVVGFVVIDEAHHAGEAKSGARAAYLDFPKALAALGHPQCLAVSATAEQRVAEEIISLFSIDASCVLKDISVRQNLHVCDCRNLYDRDSALISLIASGKKSIVYVNSREQSISLARMLRKTIPELAARIAFYNAGLTRKDRQRVEDAFRRGTLSCVVSTSAFGEGVNISDVRQVMLYHLPFGAVEFNQMSGRAGRDGEFAEIYLLFSYRDARINERLLKSASPERTDLVELYRALKVHAQKLRETEGQDVYFSVTNEELLEWTEELSPSVSLDDVGISAGLGIFSELGFINIKGHGIAREICVISDPERAELGASIRYLEGLRLREAFLDFKDWVLSAGAQEIEQSISRPIVPNFGRVVDDHVSR